MPQMNAREHQVLRLVEAEEIEEEAGLALNCP
jgi:hypothetical protein